MELVSETALNEALVEYEKGKSRKTDTYIHCVIGICICSMILCAGAFCIVGFLGGDIATGVLCAIFFAICVFIGTGYLRCALKANRVGKKFREECAADKNPTMKVTLDEYGMHVESFVGGVKYAEDEIDYAMIEEISENEKYFFLQAAGNVYVYLKGENGAEVRKFLAEKAVKK